MIRFKRGLAILLSACMIGGMMPLPASAEGTVSENIVQTECIENTENLENAPSEDEKSSETDHETGSETESETVTDAETEGTAISAIQALIDALPDADSITEDNVENVISQLDTIDEAKAELSDADISQLDLTRYDAAINKVMVLMGMKEENDSEIAVQANDSAGKTEQQSTDEEECKHENVEITFNSNGFGNCPKCNATVYQPAVETNDKYDIDDDGTKDTVYEISNAGQLYWFADKVNHDNATYGSANAVLTEDIVVNENLLDSLDYDADGKVTNGERFIGWTRIGWSGWGGGEIIDNSYNGTFDGQNHTVSGLYFNDAGKYNVGLFGVVHNDGSVSNVGVVDSCFYCYGNVGGVCGSSYGTISNCYNTGRVSGNDENVGGVCGTSLGTIMNCYNTGAVSSNSSRVGGVCGDNGQNGKISNCYNTGTVSGADAVGGVSGRNCNIITNCYNVGTVRATGNNPDVGGVCGYCWGSKTIESYCYYLDTCAADGTTFNINRGKSKTASQFASGEVTYALNQENGTAAGAEEPVWKQTLEGDSKDAAPTLKSTAGVVYQYTRLRCDGQTKKEDNVAYTNDSAKKGTSIKDEHKYAIDIGDHTHHKCSVCGETAAHTYTYEKAENTTDTIKATCSVCGDTYTIKLLAPTSEGGTLTYDGTAKAATTSIIAGNLGETLTVTYATVTDGTVSAYSTDVPVNASSYRARLTLGSGDNAVSVTVDYTIEQATPVIAEKPTAGALTYGQELSDSTLTGGKAAYQTADGTEITGAFAWKNSGIKPTAADSQKTEYDVTFTPSDKDNYNAVDTKLTLTVNKAAQAPNMPQTAMAPAHSTNKVGDITLPEGWSWQEADRDTAFADGVAVTATAVYTGADKGNYETESVIITITRSICDHTHTEIRNQQEATCKKEGYTGDTYCKDCSEKLATGTATVKKAHTVGTPATCVSKAVCSVCSETFGEVDATNHVHTTVKNRKEATCTQTGYTGDTYCTDCNKLLGTSKELAALGHDYKVTVTKQPTTTEEGVRTYTCTRCNSSYTESIAKLPKEQHTHNYAGSVTKEATCTEAGVRTYTCFCGDSYTESIPATGHSYVSKITKSATTTEEGIMTYTCSKCGHSYTHPIAKIKADDSSKDNGNQNPKPQSGTNNGNQNQKPQSDTDNGKDNGTSIKPYIKVDSGKEGWDVISAQLDEAKSGETVTVAMNGTTVVPKDIFDSIKGENVTLVLDMGNGLSWKINGQDITEPSGDIDFGVTAGADAGKSIPVDVINSVTGERYSINLTLAYDGEFGFTATLTINMEPKNSGMYANLFYYNEQTSELEFISAGQIDSDGNAELEFTHASDYTIVIDAAVMDGGNKDSINITKDNGNAEDNTTIPASNADHAKSDAWNPAIIIIIGICILLIAFGVVIFVRKKSGSEEE